jgi:hypothetical protein
LITVEEFWPVVKGILGLFWNRDVLELVGYGEYRRNGGSRLEEPSVIRLLPAEKYSTFEFNNSSILFNKNLWKWSSYNVYLNVNGNKYEVKGPGLNDDETAYTAWRKDIID